MNSDFIPAAELAQLTGRKLKTIYNDHSAKTGPLAPILTKLGGRVGAWRSDYQRWRDQQTQLKTAA